MAASFRFIDLFAGLGGFHLALEPLGGECVFACEIDESLRGLYEQNFGLKPHADIRKARPATVPDHEVLCAGFPCQSFSKAGTQEGLTCEQNGDLIGYVHRIIEHKRPTAFMLENVPNLLKHDAGETWTRINRRLSREYEVDFEVMSPHEFGIPQVRERLFIVGARRDVGGLNMFAFPEPTGATPNLRRILQRNPKSAKKLTPQLIEVIEVWNEFVRRFPKGKELPSFPIWAMEFGATYPVEGKPPLLRQLSEVRNTRGSFGANLTGVRTRDELTSLLPHHATVDEPFPRWKQTFIRQNRELYAENKKWIDPWLPKLRKFAHSYQKLEWNCKGCERDIWQHVLQVRASGIRVKRATTAPSLIAMTTTQVPIIGWERRYMTPRECAALQSMHSLQELPNTAGATFRALGNAVNVNLVELIARRLLHSTDVLAPAKRAKPREMVCASSRMG